MVMYGAYSSDEAVERQQAIAREKARVRNQSPDVGDYIDAEYVDVSATGDVKLLSDQSTDGRSNER